MPSFFVHQSSAVRSTRLVADAHWALAVRAMVGGHDAGNALAKRLTDGFVDRLVTSLASRDGSLDEQRERMASAVRNTVQAVGAQGEDGVMFTVFVAADNVVRVFNLGPQRTFLASAQSVTVLAPHSLAEELRRKGMVASAEHALISLRIANSRCAAGDIDASEIELRDGTWLIAQLDDRAPVVSLDVVPGSSPEMIERLREGARDVPHSADDWLLATA